MEDEEREMNEIFHKHSQKGKYQELIKKYPDVFKQIDSTLPIPYYLFGFECGEGWYDIIERLAAKINFELQRDKALKDLFYVTQIKEKFGGLRFYVSGANDLIYTTISEAEEESWKTCETCGEDGERRKNDYGWYSVKCEKCWGKENE